MIFEVPLRRKHKSYWYFYPAFIYLILASCILETVLASEEYSTITQSKVSAQGAKEFDLITPANLGGQVTLQVWDEDDCLVKFERRIKANTMEKAREFAEMVEMDLEREEEIVTLKLTTPHPAPWEGSNYGIKATLDVYIPMDLMVETKTSAFDVNISGPLKMVNIQNQYGGIQVKSVSEETNIRGAYSEVDVEDVQGSLNIETTYNSISVADVNTKNCKAFLQTTYGEIDLKRFQGQLEANTVYSSINGSNMILLGGRNEIKTVYSEIDLEFDNINEAELYVKNTYGNINMVVPEDLSAHLTLTVGRGGKIHSSGILIKPLVVTKTELEGVCGKEESEIELYIDGIGQIILEGK